MPDGATRWNHCIGQPQLDENGEIVSYRRSLQRHYREQRIRGVFAGKSGHFNRAILDSLSAHIAVIDREGKIVAVNEAWGDIRTGKLC